MTTGAVSGRGTKIAIEVFATGVRTTLVGVRIRFDFDASLVSFVKAENSAFALSLPEGSVGAALAATSPASLASSGFLARAEFETVADVTGREFSIGIESVTVAESPASSDVLRTSSEISFNAAPSADFDGDGTVGFSDFLTFAGAFGSIRGDSRYEAQFDLDGDGSVAFSDFLIFAGAFGSVVPRPGGDGTTPPAPGAWKMYWTDSGTRKIRRSNLDGSGVEDVVTGLENPVGIALDVSGGKMYYWTASDGVMGKIQRSNLDGSGVEDLVTGLFPTFGIALDVSGGKMYWTAFPGRIRRSNLDGSVVENLVTGLANPWGIALDVSDGKMYWTDSNIYRRKIQRSNLDGSGVEDLVTTGLESPSGIALDVSGGRMYWTDTGTEKIQRSNLDGSVVEDLVTTGLESPSGIALDVSGGKMYWTDTGTEKIQRSNLDGSVVEDLATGIKGLHGIALESRVPEVDGTDLVIQTSVSDDALTPRQSFTLRATVRNQGDAPAAATTLRYYRSDDATVSTNDTEVGTDAVSALSAGATSAESISLDAPSSAGTYYYGACVDGVSGESNTDNNCSSGVEVTVSGGGGGSGGACRPGWS